MSQSDRRDVDLFFASRGLASRRSEPAPDCLSDELLAGYVGALLPARDRQALEAHALACGDCHELLQTLASVVGIREREPAAPVAARRSAADPVAAPRSVHVIGRMVQQGMQRSLELVNAVDLVFRSLGQPGAVPALGALRGAALPAADSFLIRGPGSGLDELELQVQTDGSARLTVHCHAPPAVSPGETLSVVLEVDGTPREKRPFSGELLSFAPIGPGDYRLLLSARAPGASPRPLAEASLQLTR